MSRSAMTCYSFLCPFSLLVPIFTASVRFLFAVRLLHDHYSQSQFVLLPPLCLLPCRLLNRRPHTPSHLPNPLSRPQQSDFGCSISLSRALRVYLFLLRVHGPSRSLYRLLYAERLMPMLIHPHFFLSCSCPVPGPPECPTTSTTATRRKRTTYHATPHHRARAQSLSPPVAAVSSHQSSSSAVRPSVVDRDLSRRDWVGGGTSVTHRRRQLTDGVAWRRRCRRRRWRHLRSRRPVPPCVRVTGGRRHGWMDGWMDGGHDRERCAPAERPVGSVLQAWTMPGHSVLSAQRSDLRPARAPAPAPAPGLASSDHPTCGRAVSREAKPQADSTPYSSSSRLCGTGTARPSCAHHRICERGGRRSDVDRCWL
ncbi:hypothetical protein BC628DRAFT_907847 [Trametes gibbosa]|nr:hypothetical protein BC628DRAFT_907847 [Trametes gibbosa]